MAVESRFTPMDVVIDCRASLLFGVDCLFNSRGCSAGDKIRGDVSAKVRVVNLIRL